MWIKIALGILILSLLASLMAGLVFLMIDRGRSRRVVRALGIRLILAGLIIVLLIYGLITGQLSSQAPWEHSRAAPHKPAPLNEGRAAPAIEKGLRQ